MKESLDVRTHRRVGRQAGCAETGEQGCSPSLGAHASQAGGSLPREVPGRGGAVADREGCFPGGEWKARQALGAKSPSVSGFWSVRLPAHHPQPTLNENIFNVCAQNI